MVVLFSLFTYHVLLSSSLLLFVLSGCYVSSFVHSSCLCISGLALVFSAPSVYNPYSGIAGRDVLACKVLVDILLTKLFHPAAFMNSSLSLALYY